MSLLDVPKDSKFEQATITSVDKLKGRVGVFLKNGLQTTATYLYDIQDLRVGLSVIVSKVSNHWVIVNRVTSDAIRKSYSVPKTFNQEPYCSAEINEKDVETLETDTSVDLTVNGKPFTKYKWSVQGGGYFTNVKNDSVTYNAPSYEDEVTIILKLDDGTFCDSMDIIIYSPICTSTIGYTTQSMWISQTQNLTVENPVSGRTYHWRIASGGGSLSTDEGLSTVYTAPDSNPNCNENPTIELTFEGASNVCDTLQIAIQAVIDFPAYEIWDNPRLDECWTAPMCPDCLLQNCYVTRTVYRCDDTILLTVEYASQASWSTNPPCPYDGQCLDNENVAPLYGPSFNQRIEASPIDHRNETVLALGCCPAGLL